MNTLNKSILNTAKNLGASLLLAAALIPQAQANTFDEMLAGPEFNDMTSVLALLSKQPLEKIDQALAEGKSYSEIAQTYGIDKHVLIDTTVASQKTLLDALVSTQALSDDEASTMLSEIKKEAEYEVDVKQVDSIQLLATLVNLPIDKLEAALDQGQSIAEIAAAQNISPETVINAFIQEETAQIENEQRAGLISEEDALAELQELPATVRVMAELTTESPQRISANALNMSEETLMQKMAEGKTIKQIAQAQGVDVETIITQINASETALLQKLLDYGLMSATEYEEELSFLQKDTQALINETSSML